VERTVRQALLNILHNAVDASPRDVRVAYRWDATGLDITVIDRGGGLRSGQPGTLERLGMSSKEGGLGLGLFLSHAAITQAGGVLEAANNDEGGTTVRMHLPLMRLTEQAT
jgi:two-component system sensor histidine kinase RegB